MDRTSFLSSVNRRLGNGRYTSINRKLPRENLKKKYILRLFSRGGNRKGFFFFKLLQLISGFLSNLDTQKKERLK